MNTIMLSRQCVEFALEQINETEKTAKRVMETHPETKMKALEVILKCKGFRQEIVEAMND